MDTNPCLHVNLFGKFQVSLRDQPVEGFERRKQQELFSYLLVYRSRPHPREVLANIFWGDYPTDRSKKYLRHALWLLQSSLSQLLQGHAEILVVEDDWVGVNPQARLQLDIEEFEKACNLQKNIPAGGLKPAQVQACSQAAALYRGDLLEGCYLDWCLFKREHFQNLYIGLLDKLVDCCELYQQYEQGLEYARQGIQIDPLSERAHRQMMRLQSLSGRRSDALRQYERCVRVLREELDVSPSQQTQELFRQIRQDLLIPAGSEPEQNMAGESVFQALQSVRTRLDQLVEALDLFQEQLLEAHHRKKSHRK
jgi:DNA-binding SARP family transcriptional activator